MSLYKVCNLLYCSYGDCYLLSSVFQSEVENCHWEREKCLSLLSLGSIGQKDAFHFYRCTAEQAQPSYPECLWCSSPRSLSSDCSCVPHSLMARTPFGLRHCGRATTSLNHPADRDAHFFGCQVPGPAGPCSPTWLQQSPPLSFFMESSCGEDKDLSESLINKTFRIIKSIWTKC